MTTELENLLKDIRACRSCAGILSHEPHPVLRASSTASLCIVGQAPGTKVHQTGIPFNDASGDRLRDWLGLSRAQFYDERHIAIIPMGFCFPGQDTRGADKPPRPECAHLWREKLFALLPNVKLTLLIGQYAQRWHLKDRRYPSLTETVAHWRDYGPSVIPLPHPSWRNQAWIARNPWFAQEVLPELKRRVASLLSLDKNHS